MSAPWYRRAIWVTGALVMGLGLSVEVVHTRSHHAAVEAAVSFLSLSYEGNLPTWYSSALLLCCGLLLAAIADRAVGWRAHWWGLAAVFFYMSVDEATELHEHLGGHLETSGVLYFDWVIPAAALVGLVGLVYLKFLRSLPPATRRRFLLAGLLYLGGAIGMELPLGWWTERAGSDNLTYAMIDWVEESLEIIGATVFLLALEEHRRAAA